MSLDDLQLLSPSDVLLALAWKQEYDSKELEALAINELRAHRWTAWQVWNMNPNLKKGARIKLTDLMELPGDEPKVKIETPEEKAKRKAIFAKWDAEKLSNAS